MAAASGLALGLCLVIDPFIRLLLPKYTDAIPIIRILSIQMPLAAGSLPFIVFRAALWYKSVISLALTRFVGTLFAIAILPKNALGNCG